MSASKKAIRYFLQMTLLILFASLNLKAGVSAELVMVESSTCSWCELWEREVGVVYKQTLNGTRAPIRRLTLDGLQKQSFKIMYPVTYTPTFILVRDRKEVGRITGYPGEGYFWTLLDELLQQLPKASRYGCPGTQDNGAKTAKTLEKKLC